MNYDALCARLRANAVSDGQERFDAIDAINELRIKVEIQAARIKFVEKNFDREINPDE